MGESKRSTIKEVASEAQVSISTVSLVINEKGNVSEDTRERVLDAARRLGFIPTQAARRLASRKTGNVGFVLREDHFTRSEPFYTQIFLGTEFEARHRNSYILLTTIPSEYLPAEHTPRFIRERNVDGLIVAGKVDPAFIHEAAERGYPLVLVDYEYEQFPAVVIDNQAGSRIAVEHLLDRGHRRIAFMGADMEHPSIRARLDGYRLALASRGLGVNERYVFVSPQGEPDRWTGCRLAEGLQALDEPPSAVFCVNDAMALGVLDYARREGIDVPGSLAVVGFDDVEGALHASPALTTVRVYKEQLGELAFRYLLDLVDGSPAHREQYDRGSHTVKVGCELVVRASS